MTAAAADRDPPPVKFIVGHSACERFSFHGMRSVLVVYMAGYLLYPDQEAKAGYHLFLMVNALMPLLGGWVADRAWGRYRTILWASLAYVLGHLTLAWWDTRAGFVAGLTLITLGSGGITPCLAAWVGDQNRPDQAALMQKVHGRFSWVMTLGSATATLLIPWLLRRHGPSVAFAAPGVVMAISTWIFWAGTRHQARAPPSGPNPHGFLRVLWYAARRLGTHRAGQSWLDTALERHPAEAVDGARAVLRLTGVFGAVTVFWALFGQTGSSWVLQGQQLVGTVGPFTAGAAVLGPFELDAAQLQALNPLLVLGLVPLFTWVIFPALARRGASLAPLSKMTAGMFLTVLSFVAAAVVQRRLDGGHPTGLLWQFPQYLLLTAAEVLVSVTGLEFSFSQAPRTMRSTIMSIWFLTVFLGNLLTFLVQFVRLSGAASFGFFALLMLAAAFGFRTMARRSAAPGASPGA
jgi:POT family proton-dependent oligopeptide transporter